MNPDSSPLCGKTLQRCSNVWEGRQCSGMKMFRTILCEGKMVDV